MEEVIRTSKKLDEDKELKLEFDETSLLNGYQEVEIQKEEYDDEEWKPTEEELKKIEEELEDIREGRTTPYDEKFKKMLDWITDKESHLTKSSQRVSRDFINYHVEYSDEAKIMFIAT